MAKRRRRCKGTSRSGKRCKAWPLHGSDRCAAHPLSPDSPRFGSPEQAAAAGRLGGRPRNPRPHERMRERIEAEIEALIAPYFEAATQAVVVIKYEGEAIVTDIADWGARIAAVEKLLDRVYGKPTEAVEITGADGGPIGAEIVAVDEFDADTRKLAHDLLASAAGRAPKT
jgi:hypothetical protein